MKPKVTKKLAFENFEISKLDQNRVFSPYWLKVRFEGAFKDILHDLYLRYAFSMLSKSLKRCRTYVNRCIDSFRGKNNFLRMQNMKNLFSKAFKERR